MYKKVPALIVWILLLLPALSWGQALVQNLGGQKAGTAIFPFLKIGTSAYGAGLAGAGVAVPKDASSVFYNPSAISHVANHDVVFFHLDLPADIDYDYFALSTPLGTQGHLGLSMGSLHMDPMIETTEYMPFGTGRTFTYSDEFLACTYSLQLSDRFTFGTTLKFARETLDNHEMQGLLLDFGTFYETGFRSLRIAAAMTNFGATFKPTGVYSKTILNQAGEAVLADSLQYQSFSPPTTFSLGAAYEFIDNEYSVLTGAFQLTHPADAAENYSFGLDYLLLKMLSMRCGYVMNKDGFGLALGGGLQIGLPAGIKVRFDYSYTTTTTLTEPQRYSIGFSL
ncbi:PorV/PorQ family protein [bacterium]|nr:PorV/PorQ family protein [bacterium]